MGTAFTAQHAALHATAERMVSLLANFQFDANTSYTSDSSGAAVEVTYAPSAAPWAVRLIKTPFVEEQEAKR
jgi:hypothetical protein